MRSVFLRHAGILFVILTPLSQNGQIDYFLNSGGGPLEIQYLNILSAHSSYWASKEFVRFLVVEIGRAPGRESTLVNMRAVKKSFLK